MDEMSKAPVCASLSSVASLASFATSSSAKHSAHGKGRSFRRRLSSSPLPALPRNRRRVFRLRGRPANLFVGALHPDLAPRLTASAWLEHEGTAGAGGKRGLAVSAAEGGVAAVLAGHSGPATLPSAATIQIGIPSFANSAMQFAVPAPPGNAMSRSGRAAAISRFRRGPAIGPYRDHSARMARHGTSRAAAQRSASESAPDAPP